MTALKRLPILLALVLMLASAAFAQTSGNINVTGANPEAVSLTNTSGAALSATIALGSLTPGNTNGLTTGTADVHVRSNKAYNITAQASALSFTNPGAAAGGDDIALTDIGFAVTGTTLTGANVVNSGSRTDAPAAGFALGAGWPTATNGLTPGFGKTLADITGSTTIMSGPRISKKGNMATDNNFIAIQFGVATLPQLHTPNQGFSTTITLTIAAQ
jgi:hypothetical protein